MILLAIFAAMAVASGCGSSDHSSEWTAAESSALEEKLAGEIPEFTGAGISCYAKGIEAAFPPSEAGGESANSDSGKKTLEGIANECAESSENVQGILSQACKEEGILGENCLSEVTGQTEEEYGYPEESYEGEEVEENPEALEELDEERKQEIEQEEAEGLVTPESSSP